MSLLPLCPFIYWIRTWLVLFDSMLMIISFGVLDFGLSLKAEDFYLNYVENRGK